MSNSAAPSTDDFVCRPGTVFRYADRGDRPGNTKACTTTRDGKVILELTHRDTAEVRVTNIGRRRRKNPSDRGYWLDFREGAWLSDDQASDKTVDSESLRARKISSSKRKSRPTSKTDETSSSPAWPAAQSTGVEVTLKAALERAIEITFQLEGSSWTPTPCPTSTVVAECSSPKPRKAVPECSVGSSVNRMRSPG